MTDNRKTARDTGKSGFGSAKTPASTNVFSSVIAGVGFFSRLPVGGVSRLKPDFKAMVRVLPLASLIIGIVPAIVLALLAMTSTNTLFAALVATGLASIVTGAMSEDGFADTIDGFFGGVTIERRLEIMKDSRLGTYGVLGTICAFLLRATALAAIAETSPTGAAAIFLAATILARSGAMWIAYQLPAVRTDGLSASAGMLPRSECYVGIGLALISSLVICALAGAEAGWAIAVALCMPTLFGCRKLFHKFLGGQTGDTIGATQLALEIVVLSSFMYLYGN